MAAGLPCLWDGASERRVPGMPSLHPSLLSPSAGSVAALFPNPVQRLCGCLTCISSLCPYQVSETGRKAGCVGRQGRRHSQTALQAEGPGLLKGLWDRLD